MSTALTEIKGRLKGTDTARRIGQALWMMTGRPIAANDLLWAAGTLGDGGDKLLWQALLEFGALAGKGQCLHVRRLAEFLCRLFEPQDEPDPDTAHLVWTLPSHLNVPGVTNDSYVRAAASLIEGASHRLTLVAPYLEPKGMGRLHSALVEALYRRVDVSILAHETDSLSSLASASLDELRRASVQVGGRLTVYSAAAVPAVLLHLKVVVADGVRATLGSANLTGKGLGENVEAGVLLGAHAAAEIERVVAAVVSQGLARKVFATSNSELSE
jgi:phosphatidylserine/phosphatidylglycerophosphate/cardiolipin synthase-like enzyme